MHICNYTIVKNSVNVPQREWSHADLTILVTSSRISQTALYKKLHQLINDKHTVTYVCDSVCSWSWIWILALQLSSSALTLQFFYIDRHGALPLLSLLLLLCPEGETTFRPATSCNRCPTTAQPDLQQPQDYCSPISALPAEPDRKLLISQSPPSERSFSAPDDGDQFPAFRLFQDTFKLLVSVLLSSS